jgi:large subunit ribosomal protein L15
VNIFREEVAILNVRDLERFEAGTTISPASLQEAGLVSAAATLLKILGNGTLSKALTVSAHRFSKGATAKIEAAGGRVEVIAS